MLCDCFPALEGTGEIRGDKGRASNHFESWSFRNRKASGCGPAGPAGFSRAFLAPLAAAQDEQLCVLDLWAVRVQALTVFIGSSSFV